MGEKDAGRLVIIDPETLEIVARIPAGGNLHELATDGRYVYIGSNLPGITVVDVMAQKRVEPIDISAFGDRHAITFAGRHLYVGHETNRLISRYDPVKRSLMRSSGSPVDPTCSSSLPMNSAFSLQAAMAGSSRLSIG